MANESGEWIMRGMAWDDPLRIRTYRELINYIDQVGFLPLFANEVPGFSVEEHVSPDYWWSGDREQDPWEWRQIIAATGEVVYGKYFHRKAGFVSKAWFPAFANYRRDGYDFDALWDDELASYREKKIMDLFEENEELFSYEIKEKAGFGKDGGMKNFEGVMTDLQMQGYLAVRDFRRRKRKKDGAEYGWAIAVFTPPERIVGAEALAEGYREDPAVSAERIFARIREEYPWAEENQIRKIIKLSEGFGRLEPVPNLPSPYYGT